MDRPLCAVVAVAAALVSGRLAWYQSLAAGLAMVVCLAAWQSLHFLLPGLSSEVTWAGLIDRRWPALSGWLMLGMVLAPLGARAAALARCWPAMALSPAVVALLTGVLFPWVLRQPPSDSSAQGWVDVTPAAPRDARERLVPDAREQGGFRINSERAVVGEWRDGTQLYFSPAFAKAWWERMNALQPGMVLDLDGKSLLSRGPARTA